MKKLLLLLIIPFLSFGQGWEQTYDYGGFAGGKSVQQTTDGGYIITGGHSLDSQNNIFLLKTDENGTEQWSQIYEKGQGSYYAGSVQQTTDGGFIITGSRSLDSQNNIFLLKTDENGTEQWSQTVGEGSGLSGQQTEDGGYIITGYLINKGDRDVVLIKTNVSGTEQWTKLFGNENAEDMGRSVQQTTDGGYIITGSWGWYILGENISVEESVWLLKTDSEGEEEWTQFFGGTGIDIGYSVQQTTGEGYIVTGSTQSFIDNGSQSVYLIKTNGSGTEQWYQLFNDYDNDGSINDLKGYSVQQTNDYGYVIFGYVRTTGNTFSTLLIKTDGYGNEQWFKVYDQGGWDIAYSGQQTNDGGYIMCGKQSFVDEDDSIISSNIYLIKTDSEGNVINTSTIELPTPTSKRELVKTTNILGQENTNIKNQPLIEIYDDGSVEKKYLIK